MTVSLNEVEHTARRDFLKRINSVVIKVGSAVLADEDGLNLEVINSLCRQVSELKKQGKKITLVSSGAIAAGQGKMPGLPRPRTVPEKQAMAAIGQSRLMQVYEDAFDAYGFAVAQVLVTREGLVPRHRYVNAKNTIRTLHEWGVIPIINENDTVATEELQFTDNDALAALMVNVADSEALICLSDIDGLYDGDPRDNPSARLIPQVKRVDESIMQLAGDTPGRAGRGGMRSKLESARMVTACGIPMIVAAGRSPDIILRIFDGEEVGTLFLPRDRRRLKGRKPWIAFTLARKGSVFIDSGAEHALVVDRKSLLAVGIKRVSGKFDAGDCLSVINPQGEEIAVGVTNYSSDELEKICGCRSGKICKIVGHEGQTEVIHRDNLVIMR